MTIHSVNLLYWVEVDEGVLYIPTTILIITPENPAILISKLENKILAPRLIP